MLLFLCIGLRLRYINKPNSARKNPQAWEIFRKMYRKNKLHVMVYSWLHVGFRAHFSILHCPVSVSVGLSVCLCLSTVDVLYDK